MTKKNRAQQTAPNADVRVKLRLYNGARKLRDVEIPSDLDATSIFNAVGRVEQNGVRVNTQLHAPQLDGIIEAAKDVVAKVRVKNPVAVLAMREWMHTLYGIRKYKLATARIDRVRVVVEAWPTQS